MKFIRSIIDERAGDSARAGSPAGNRTYTRVSTTGGETDDLVERLLAGEEDAPLSRRHPDPLDDLLDRAYAEEDDNLFAEDEDGDDAQETADSDLPMPPRDWSLYADPTPAGRAMSEPPPADPMPIAGPVSGRSAAVALPEPPAADPMPRPMAPVEVPAPASGRSAPSAGRVKTRLLGFGGDMAARDPFAQPGTGGDQPRFPVGWLVIVAGPGRGHAFTLSPGVSQIGRGEDQTIRLDFGDTAISRSNHAAVAYDPEEGAFYLGHGGKANMVRLNNRPVLSTEPMSHGALIRIGETTLRFAAFCDNEFNWHQDGTFDHASHR